MLVELSKPRGVPVGLGDSEYAFHTVDKAIIKHKKPYASQKHAQVGLKSGDAAYTHTHVPSHTALSFICKPAGKNKIESKN